MKFDVDENIGDLEKAKFGENDAGDIFVRTFSFGTLIDFEYDDVKIAYCGITAENITNLVYINSLVTQASILISYDGTNLMNMTNIVRA